MINIRASFWVYCFLILHLPAENGDDNSVATRTTDISLDLQYWFRKESVLVVWLCSTIIPFVLIILKSTRVL